jgi:hypothetical protein
LFSADAHTERYFKEAAVTLDLIRCVTLAACIAASLTCRRCVADAFTSSYTDGSSWNTLYGQGFSPSEAATPNPGLAFDAVVPLDRFDFFKSGNVDSAVNFRLAILSNFFVNLDALTTTSPELVGLSTNTIANSAGIATGAPITFSFDSVPLTYGENYAAIYVTEGAGGAMSPVLVSSMLADYVEDPVGSGTYRPESNYGDPDADYLKSATNFITVNEFGRFLAAFNAPYADASFVAYFDQPAASIPGDFNNSQTVDGADLTLWRQQFGQTTSVTADGDADGDADGNDYLIWQRNVGATPALGAAAAIPEPGALRLALIVFAGAVIARRRIA